MDTLREFFSGRPLLRRSLKAAMAVVIGLMILLITLRVLLATPPGRSFVEARLESMSVSGQAIDIDGLNGDLLGRFQIETLRVSDVNGTWGTIERLDAKWSPLSLLGRHLKITEIGADRIIFDRQPVISPGAESGDNGASPIKRYSIAELRIDAIDVNAAITGRDETFSMDASLETRLESGGASLALVPNVETDDRALVDLSWGQETGIEGTIEATGPEDGLLHALLQLNGPGAVELAASAGGTASDWGGALSLKLGDDEIVQIEGSRGAVRGSGEGRIVPDAFKPLSEYASRLGGPIDILLGFDPVTSVLDVELDSTNLNLTAAGLWPEEGTASLDLVASSDAPEQLLQIDRVEGDRLEIAGPLSISAEELAFTGQVQVEAPRYQDYRAAALVSRLDITYEPDSRMLAGGLSVSVRELDGNSDQITDIVGEAPSLSTRFGLPIGLMQLALAQTRVELAAGSITASGGVDLNTLALNLWGGADLDLSGFGATVDELRWTVRGPLEDIRIGLDSEVALTGLPDSITEWGRDPLSVSADGSVGSDGTLILETLEASNSALALSASGSLRSGRLEGEASLDIASGAAAGLTFSPVIIRANTSGPIEDLTIAIDGGSSSVTASGETLDAVALSLEGKVRDGAMSGQTQLDASWRDLPVLLKTNFGVNGARWALQNLEGQFAELQLRGDLSGDGADLETMTGVARLNGPIPLLQTGGAIDGVLDFDREIPVLDATLSDLMIDVQRIEAVVLQATYENEEIRLRSETNGQTDLTGIDLPFNVVAQTDIAPADQTALISFEGALGDAPFATDGPLALIFAEGLDMQGALNLLGGQVVIDASRTTDAFRASVKADALDLAYVSRLADVPQLTGRAGLSASIDTAGERLIGHGGVRLVELRRAGLEGEGAFQTRLDFDLADEVLAISGEVFGPDGESLFTANSALPVISQAHVPSIAPTELSTLTASFKGSGSIGTLWQLLGVDEIDASGAYAVDITLSRAGDVFSPAGTVKLTGARVEDQIAGLRLVDINFDSALDADGVNVRALTANGPKGGTLSGSGRYDFDGGAGVELQLDKLAPFQRSDVEGTISGLVRVTRGERITRIGGDVTLDRLEVDVTKLPQAGYTTLDVRFAEDANSGNGTTESSPIEFDLHIDAPRRVFIEGGGVRTEWGFDTQITGNATSPSIFGDARIVRGDIDVVGRNFQFDESVIRFNGSPEDAILDIQAIREQGDFTAEINVDGTLRSPEIALSSSPEVPEDEVLSRVLFGRSPTELSAFEAAQLALAVASIGRGNLSMIGGVGDTLGVDRLDFGLSDSGVPSIGAGKYITPDLYLELRSTPRGNAGLNLEWTPRRNLEVSTELESNDAPRFGIQWKRDFEFGKKAEQAEKDAHAPATSDEPAENE